jgi:transcription initiation factor TFIIB
MKRIKKCPECGSENLLHLYDKGEIICKECGLVIESNIIDEGQEWREFDESDENQRRAGSPLTYTQFDQGLGTKVGGGSDLSKLSSKAQKTFKRLNVWHNRVSTAIERNLKMALSELRRVSSFLNLPKPVEEEAARIYTLAVQKGLVRGRSMESVVSGAVYAACRRHDVPRTLNEISESSGIDRKEIGRTYRFVTRELEINIIPSNPNDYIDRFSNSLHLSPQVRATSLDILEKCQDFELTSGRGPTGIAAAALYVASLIHGEKRTQREVAEIAGVTEVTIRNRYKELLEVLNLEEKIKKSKKNKKNNSE